jgi:hypothetical protein
MTLHRKRERKLRSDVNWQGTFMQKAPVDCLAITHNFFPPKNLVAAYDTLFI